MIIVLAWDDTDILDAALDAAFNDPRWGDVYQMDLTDPANQPLYKVERIGDAVQRTPVEGLPVLDAAEAVLFSGHAILDDKGDSKIGTHTEPMPGEVEDFGFSGRELYENFKEIFPDTWQGGTFIDGCETADSPVDGFSLSENFKSAIEDTLGGGAEFDVYGRVGEAAMEIPKMESIGVEGGWTIAEL